MYKSREYKKYLIPIIFNITILSIFIYYKAKLGLGIIEADSASDIAYAHLLSEEGAIISNNWYFSTELRLLDNELLFALLFRFFPSLSWWTIEVLGTVIMNIILGITSTFLAFQLGMKEKSLWIFGFTLLPYSTSELYYVLLHGCGYYVYATTQVFLLLGLFFGIINKNNKTYIIKIELILFLSISLLAGLQGIRLLENLFIPLFLSTGFLMILKIYHSKDRYKIGNVAIFIRNYGYTFLISSLGTCCAFIGFFINKTILSKKYYWEQMENLQWKPFSFESVNQIITEIISNIGYIEEINLFSLNGLLNIFPFAILLIIIYILLRCLKRKSLSQIDEKEKILITFFGIALMVHTFIYAFLLQQYKARYMLPFFVLLIHIIGIEIKKFHNQSKKVILTFLCICLFFSNINIFNYMYHLGNHQDINVEKQKEMAEFLVDQGYTYGFARFWYANSTVQLCNGKLNICPIYFNSNNGFTKKNWLCTKEEIDYTWNESTFLILSEEQWASELMGKRQEQMIWSDSEICVLGFSSVQEMKEFLENRE